MHDRSSDSSEADDADRARVIDDFWELVAAAGELGRDLARTMRLHTTDSAAIVEILRAEERGEPVSPAWLAARIGLTSGATSILLNRLETGGYVERRRGHADRRRVTLHATRAVHAPFAAFQDPLRATFEAILAGYEPDQVQLVAGLLSELRAAVLEHHLAHAGPPADAPG